MTRILLVVGALAVALWLRVWGLSFGLDFHEVERAVLSHQNDELAMAASVRDRLLRGDLHPGAYLHWGSGGFLIQGAVDALVFGARGLDAELDRLVENPSSMLLVHRWISVIAALLTVWVAARVASRELSPPAGPITALLLAGCYLHVRESHFGTLEAMLGAASALVLDRCSLWMRDGRARDLAFAGAAAGLAASIKYSGVLLALPIVAAFLARRERSSWRPLVLSLGAATAVGLLMSPHVFFALDDLRAMLERQSEVIGFRAARVPAVIAFHATRTFWIGCGETMTLLALVGVVAMLADRRRRPVAIVLLLTFAALITTRTMAVRYGVPGAAWVALFAAAGILRIAGHGPRRHLWRGLLVVVAMAPSLVRSVTFDRLLTTVDTRVPVVEILSAEPYDRLDVLLFGVYGVPDVVHAPFLKIAYDNPAWDLERALALRPRYLVVLTADPFLAEGIALYWPGASDEYELVLDLESRRDGETPALPDMEHGTPDFFVPFARPWSMTRTGPPIRVYERIADRG